jgi:sirohydrochlorin ferrochelatase
VAVAHLDFTEPGVGEALTELAAEGAREIAVVPLLFAPGYHLRVDLPSAVAEVRAGLPWLSVSIAEPLAAAPELDEPDALLDALEARLSERTSEYDAVVLASAGSSDPVARQAIEAVAVRWTQRLGRPVDAAYATAATPTVAEAVTRLRAQGSARVAVSGLFIAPGRLPEAVRRSADEAGAVAVAEPLGAAPGLVRLVARRSNRAKAHSLDAH